MSGTPKNRSPRRKCGLPMECGVGLDVAFAAGGGHRGPEKKEPCWRGYFMALLRKPFSPTLCKRELGTYLANNELNWPKSWPTSPNVGRPRTRFGRSCTRLAEIARQWPTSIPNWPTSRVFFRNRPQIGRSRPKMAEHAPELAHIAKLGYTAQIGRVRVAWSRLKSWTVPEARTCKSDHMGKSPTRLRHGFGGNFSQPMEQPSRASHLALVNSL